MHLRVAVLALACILLIPSLASSQTEFFVWTQSTRGSAGWSTPLEKSAKIVRHSTIGNTLVLVGVLDDSDPQNELFMELRIPNYSGERTDPPYPAGEGTQFKYGARSDMVYTKTPGDQWGKVFVTKVDPDDNTVKGTFEWIGKARLQNGIELELRVTNGTFSVVIPPKIGLEVRPPDNVKVKPEDDHKVGVFARNVLFPDKFLKNVNLTLRHDGTVFEGEKTLTATTDDDGYAAFDLKVKRQVEKGPYKYYIDGSGDNYKDADTDTAIIDLDPSDQYYYSKCKGAPFIEFDAGDDETWDEAGTNRITSSSGRATMQGLFTFTDITIDTLGGGAKVTAGSLVIPNVEFDGKVQDLTIVSPVAFITPSCDAVVDFLADEMLTKWSGGVLKKPIFEFVGNSVPPSGVRIGATMPLGKNKYSGCNAALSGGTIWAPNSEAEVSLEMTLINTGTTIVASGKGTLSNWSPAPAWCMKETTVEYKGAESLFAFNTKFSCPLFSDAEGGLEFRAGALKSAKVRFILDRCTPIPQLPSVCWRGGGLSFDGFDQSPLKGDIEAVFGPYDPLKDFYELSFKAGFESAPFKVSGGVTGKLLKVEAVSSSKPWQVELSGTGTLEPGAFKGSLDVTAKAFHLGGDYALDGKLNASLTLHPVGISGSYAAKLTIPALSAENADKLGTAAKFFWGFAPFELGSTTTTLALEGDGNRNASIAYDFRNLVAPPGMPETVAKAMREIGKGKAFVDFNKLPSPGAFELEGGFAKLFGGNVAAKGTGDKVQAADVRFTVAAETECLIVATSSDATVVSTLRTPGGTVLSETNESEGIHYVHNLDGTGSLWVVKNPEAGEWTFSAPDAGSDLAVEALGNEPDPVFTPSGRIEGDRLIVEWTGSRIADTTMVQVYVDNDSEGTDGTLVGTATFVDGTLSVPLSDTLFPCSFNVYTLIVGRDIGQIDYLQDSFSNPLLSFPVPELISAVSDEEGNTTVTWEPVVDPRITEVAIINNATGETVITAFAHEGQATVQLAGHELLELTMIAISAAGQTSCHASPFEITTDVDEDVITTGGGLSLLIKPHPVHDRSSFSVLSDHSGVADIRVIDTRGVVTMQQQVHLLQGAVATVQLDASTFTSGIYTVVVTVGDHVISHPLVVVK